jgi:hypothetical protein
MFSSIGTVRSKDHHRRLESIPIEQRKKSSIQFGLKAKNFRVSEAIIVIASSYSCDSIGRKQMK